MGAVAQLVDERRRRHGLVRHDEDRPLLGLGQLAADLLGGEDHRVARAGDAVLVRAADHLRVASKLKSDGGDETSHSSVRPRHGFQGAFGP